MKRLISLLICTLCFSVTRAFDTAHFFRPPFLERGPWFEKNWLSALYANGAHGKTHTALNCAGKEVPLLDIYGRHDIAASINGLSNLTAPLQQMAAFANNNNFTSVSLGAKAHITEIMLEGYQNFKKGFFFHWLIPVRRIKISNTRLENLSCESSCTENQQANLVWQRFLQQYTPLLQEYGVSPRAHKNQGCGDFGMALGWSRNFECFDTLDFVDITLQLGATAPTSKQIARDYLFDIPLGYNGHTGIFGKYDISCGVLSWLTFGSYLTVLGFDKHLQQEKIYTAQGQSGLIILQQAPVQTKLGTIISCGLLARADHFLHGCSFDLEYQFQYQGKQTWYNCATREYYTLPDQRLQSWMMHTINVELSYDFANVNHPNAPIIGFIYNLPVAGERIFKSPMGGLSFALIVSWTW